MYYCKGDTESCPFHVIWDFFIFNQNFSCICLVLVYQVEPCRSLPRHFPLWAFDVNFALYFIHVKCIREYRKKLHVSLLIWKNLCRFGFHCWSGYSGWCRQAMAFICFSDWVCLFFKLLQPKSIYLNVQDFFLWLI